MAGLTDRLTDFLSAAEARAYAPGVWDCCLFPADWVLSLTGVDGAAPWRGRYDSERGLARILIREGGIVGVMQRGADLVGLEATTAPVRNDIAAVRLPCGTSVGAVFAGRAWVRPTTRGLAASPAIVLKAWRVNA